MERGKADSTRLTQCICHHPLQMAITNDIIILQVKMPSLVWITQPSANLNGHCGDTSIIDTVHTVSGFLVLSFLCRSDVHVPFLAHCTGPYWPCDWWLSVRRISIYLLFLLLHATKSTVIRHTSYVIRHTSYVIRHTSYVIRHTSYVIRHTSYVVRITTYVIRHTSYVIRHTSYVIPQ